MEWIYTKDKKPTTYLTGHWDGKKYLAHYCEGFMDGSSFEDWYDGDNYEITTEIVRYIKIPD
jgi:hypothetical protein